MRVSVSKEAVASLKKLVTRIEQIRTQANRAVASLQAKYTEKQTKLGAHTKEVAALLENLQKVQKDSDKMLTSLEAKLSAAVAIRTGLIDTNVYGDNDTGDATGTVGGGVAAGIVAGGAMAGIATGSGSGGDAAGGTSGYGDQIDLNSYSEEELEALFEEYSEYCMNIAADYYRDKLDDISSPFTEGANLSSEQVKQYLDTEYNKIRDHYSSRELLSRVNPHYKEGVVWQINCQNCVVCYELAMRGYDVAVQPRQLNDYILACDPYAAWEDADVLDCPNGRSDIEHLMEEWGEGARAQVTVMYSKKAGHTFVCVMENGIPKFYDPQTNDPVAADNFIPALEGSVQVARIDTLKPSSLALKAVTKP